ncbi:MAG TPA: KH domain-containing protein [Clostridia bacterium]|nr:KH domain-containing protein [Clostridia bacterium]
MKDFLLKIVAVIVDQPEKIEIQEETDNNLRIYTLLVPEEEIGRVIGKGGKVINAIRCLARIKGIKNQEKVLVKVEAAQSEKGLSRPTPAEAGSSETASA